MQILPDVSWLYNVSFCRKRASLFVPGPLLHLAALHEEDQDRQGGEDRALDRDLQQEAVDVQRRQNRRKSL